MAYSNRPMRRSALISPWGVGSIVPFPNDESLMIAGLDMWRYNTIPPFIIEDERLTRRLGVNELRWPPDYRERNADAVNCYLKIPTVRFPTWYYCPFCGTMRKTTYYEEHPECDRYPWPKGRKCNPKYKKKKMVPERFVVVCPEGHIDDFPVAEWLHYGMNHQYNKRTCRIRRSTGGTSAALTGVFYECSCGAKKSIAGVTRLGALQRIDYKCKGSKPWLGIAKDEPVCGSKDAKVLLRGATNVWFADTRSSLYIPTDDKSTNSRVKSVLDANYNMLKGHRVNGEWNRDFINILADSKGIDRDTLYAAFVNREINIENITKVTEHTSEDEYRLSEYKVLITNSGNDTMDFHSKNYTIDNYDQRISEFFKSISLVPKLRETRAFVGFSRLEPRDASISEKKKILRLGNENWLPAIEVYGEGIFFEFNKELIHKWAQNISMQLRVEKLNQTYKESNFGRLVQGNLRPEFVLIHTFAHLLINQLSFACGYGSSALRERIYCEKTSNEHQMYGVLIYTASGDSEGSLGGLVRQGEPGRIEDTIADAVKNAQWCTSDPICIQSSGQGPESCNLAACHNCSLLPETSCEHGNRLLDRATAIGELDNRDMGFFKNLAD